MRDRLNAANPVEMTGNLMAAIVLSLIVFSLLGGFLTDRIGRRRMHLLAAVLVGVGSLLMLPARTPWAVLVFGSILGAGIGVFLTANWALANDLAPAGEAGKFLGLTNIATAGAGATSRLAGPIIDGLNLAAPGRYLGYAALFVGAAVLSSASLLALRRVPESIERKPKELECLKRGRAPNDGWLPSHRFALPHSEAHMPEPMVECIPNFSEGRRPEVVESIRSAIAAVSGVFVLDVHSDRDHNRSVITFAGPPSAVTQAAFAAIARAAELIDLDRHSGEHPRIGATDVVPFVPLAGISIDDCVRLARELGRRVGEELGIPVYLYEAAATRPERTNLEDLRRGQYEGLRQAITEDPSRAPDFGPHRLGKAGATVIGARAPLIAFNIYLSTSDVRVAKEVARAVRASSGGLPFVKALGLEVEGRAQVSMNLTDYTRAPLALVVERVREEAAERGASILKSELVGLIPQAALVEAAAFYLRLEAFRPDQILEVRLQSARQAGAEADLLDRLAAATPTPGGGSAAAYAGAMAASLVGMVGRLTLGKKKYADVQPRIRVHRGRGRQPPARS